MAAPEGLKKARGKTNVFRLQQDLDAWNVDGSSADKPPGGSWIGFWEQSTGRTRGKCAFSDCRNPAEDGGHVWIRGHSSVPRKVCWIVPICKGCNDCENPARMQNAEGNHSRLRAGSWVMRTKFTDEMANSDRRVAMDYTSEYDSGYETDDMEVDDDVDVDEDDDLNFFIQPRERRCEQCSSDISEKPANHKVCYNCFSGRNAGSDAAAKRPRER